MSRSGYSYDLDDSALNLWRGAVKKATEGARGQAFLYDLVQALDAMKEKRLINEFLAHDGQFCAVGAVAHTRGIPVDKLDGVYGDPDVAARFVDIAPALAAETMFMNDEMWPSATPEERWRHVREWAVAQIERAAQ